MSMLALFTAKGAPGATTNAILVAALWPRRALLVDCDPAGGDIALRLPAANGSTLDVSTGMLTLLPLARRPMSPADVLSHAQVALGGTEILAGIASPDQATAAGSVWDSLAGLFAALPDHDTILDLGRLHPSSAVLPLAKRANLAVCVVQASLSGTIAARARLRTVVPALAGDGFGPRCGFVVRAADRSAAEATARVLYEEFEELSYFGWLPDDAIGASLFDGGRVARPERTMLVRSSVGVVEQLDAALPPDSKRGVDSTVAPPGTPPPAAALDELTRPRAQPSSPQARSAPGPQAWPAPGPQAWSAPVTVQPQPGTDGAKHKRGPRFGRRSAV